MNGKYWPHIGKCWYNACLYNPWLVFPLEQDDHSFISFHSQLIFLYGVRTFSAFVCWFSPGTAASSHSPKTCLFVSLCGPAMEWPTRVVPQPRPQIAGIGCSVPSDLEKGISGR